MSVGAEILASYRDPAGPVGRLIAAGPREDRALAMLMAAAVLQFVARAPALARAAHLDPSVPLDARLGISLFAMLFMLPLLAYGLAMIAHLFMRMLGRTGAAAGARVALFWALLAIAPVSLLHGLIEGLAGPVPLVRFLGAVVFAGFLWFWGRGMAVAYRRQRGESRA
ncbi:MAG: hypothetical protein IT551_08525 [Novosphingobium sp.]|nr:hypothetical protein [Novosphingobium sp.]